MGNNGNPHSALETLKQRLKKLNEKPREVKDEKSMTALQVVEERKRKLRS
jgi:hypothetical protein